MTLTLQVPIAMKAHVPTRLNLTVGAYPLTIAHAITLNTISRFCDFCPPNSYHFPSVATRRTLHGTTCFGFLYILLLSNYHLHDLFTNCVDQKSYFILNNFYMTTRNTVNCLFYWIPCQCECNHDEKIEVGFIESLIWTWMMKLWFVQNFETLSVFHLVIAILSTNNNKIPKCTSRPFWQLMIIFDYLPKRKFIC